MPTYEYVCDACEHAFEEFQPISAKPLRKCPDCGKPRLRRLIGTGAGVIFKGSGFYETDYRSEGYKKSEKAESGDGKAKLADGNGKASGDTAKTDNKADTAPSSKPPAKPASGGASGSTGKSGGEKKSGGDKAGSGA